MALNLKKNKLVIDELKKKAKIAISAVIADFCGVQVNQMTELRKKCRESGVYIRVIKNTLLHRVILETKFKCLKEMFIGQNLIAFSNKNPGTAARILKEFSKQNKNFKIKAAAFKGDIILASHIDKLATLPTAEEAISRLMFVIKEASAGKLVRTLSALCENKLI